MGPVASFFIPYVQICLLAAWGIAQNLEGLGLFGVLNDAPAQFGQYTLSPLYLNPLPGVLTLSVLTMLTLVYGFVTTVRAGFYLGPRAGALISLLWLAPGVAAIFGTSLISPQSGPDVFRFNAGFTGSVGPAAASLFLFLTAGWSTVMLVGVRWKKDPFKNAYDHLWYSLGLVAALYFVTDSGLPFYRDDLDDATSHYEKLLDTYMAAAPDLSAACATSSAVRSTSPLLCETLPAITRGIKLDRELQRPVRPSVDLGNWTQALRRPAIAAEIARLSALPCDTALPCHKYPIEIALNADAHFHGHGFPPNAYLDSFPKYRASLVKAHEKIASTERSHNFRYFAFLAVAFLAGGKLANASRSLRAVDKVRPASWLLIAMRSPYRISKQIVTIVRFVVRVARGDLARAPQHIATPSKSEDADQR
jgi:hypothetical protein